jgi:hypothetical protein
VLRPIAQAMFGDLLRAADSPMHVFARNAVLFILAFPLCLLCDLYIRAGALMPWHPRSSQHGNDPEDAEELPFDTVPYPFYRQIFELLADAIAQRLERLAIFDVSFQPMIMCRTMDARYSCCSPDITGFGIAVEKYAHA